MLDSHTIRSQNAGSCPGGSSETALSSVDAFQYTYQIHHAGSSFAPPTLSPQLLSSRVRGSRSLCQYTDIVCLELVPRTVKRMTGDAKRCALSMPRTLKQLYR